LSNLYHTNHRLPLVRVPTMKPKGDLAFMEVSQYCSAYIEYKPSTVYILTYKCEDCVYNELVGRQSRLQWSHERSEMLRDAQMVIASHIVFVCLEIICCVKFFVPYRSQLRPHSGKCIHECLVTAHGRIVRRGQPSHNRGGPSKSF